MPTHTITITATNANPYPLSISDDEGNTANTETTDAALTTKISAGDTVIWVPAGNISSIDNIIDKSAPLNLFSAGPANMNDGTGRWSGTVGTQPSDTEESYSLVYTVNGVQHTEDPKLKMN